ncbi:hypothetical protein [Lelliottia jeotgali]
MAASEEAWRFAGAVVPALIGIGGVIVGAALTNWRERDVSRKKAIKDAVFLAAIIGGELDNMIARCGNVVDDDGQRDVEGDLCPMTELLSFEPSRFEVEWRSIPENLAFDLLDLPYQIEFANSSISNTADYDHEPDYVEVFQERHFQYARLGLHCLDIATRLRDFAKMKPRTKSYEWDPGKKFREELERIETLRQTPQSLPEFSPPARD